MEQLSNKELVERVNNWVTELIKTGGRAWTLNIPARENSDPDLLIAELCSRFTKLTTEQSSPSPVEVESPTIIDLSNGMAVAFDGGEAASSGETIKWVKGSPKKTGKYYAVVLSRLTDAEKPGILDYWEGGKEHFVTGSDFHFSTPDDRIVRYIDESASPSDTREEAIKHLNSIQLYEKYKEDSTK